MTTVHYLTASTPVGTVTLFEEDGAIISLEWGRGPEPDPTPLLQEAHRQLNAYFDGALTAFDLPLSPRGTEYRQKIWHAMRTIPYGDVRTYGDLAKSIGGAPRAVGGACGANPIPIFIPCHRVVGSNGKLTGFSGGAGVDTKRHLLTLEGALLA